MNRPLQDELVSALAAVLDDMQQAANQLVQVLDAERTALDERNNEALDQAGSQKQALMLKLEQLDIERQQLSREQPSMAGALESVWISIMQSLRECRQLNQRNGSAVSQRLGLVRQALATLTGHAGEDGLYGRSGELRASLRSQVLAAA